MEFALWMTLGGTLLLALTLGGTVLARWPLSTAMLMLAVGVALGPLGAGLAAPSLAADAPLLERVSEVIVLLSLFGAGLKMSAGLHDRRWSPPLRLALLSMALTVALVAAIGVWGLGLPLGAAVLLGGILAPTDPVLATEVQVADAADRDQLRFALTGEGGLNDGTAFPVVMLGLGLLGLHDIGSHGWRWLALDLLWATAAGLAVGGALGVAVGRAVLYLRRRHHEALGHENFLALGLIGLAYGAALLVHGYGFLAVFAAGLALRRTEQRATRAAGGVPARAAAAAATALSAPPRPSHHRAPGTGHGASDSPSPSPSPNTSASSSASASGMATADLSPADRLATHPRHASAFMAYAVMVFNDQLDRFGELAGVVVIGLLLWAVPWVPAALWFVPLLLLGVRPLAVALGLAGSGTSPTQRRLVAWFGIRGIGSLYYLCFALNHGLAGETAQILTGLTLAVVVSSIVVHGVSVTPLMARYRRGASG
jgi:NhaP-type Na+/H+ or K+/H+ antiporter